MPGANNNTYDFGDQPIGTRNYGSMQINNYGANQSIIAYNQWGGNNLGPSDLGIGNQPSGNPDWTFAYNANTYTVKTLQVLVDGGITAVPEPASMSVLALGLAAASCARRRSAR